MASQGIWIGIAIGVFFAGLGIGYAVFQSSNQLNFANMTPQQMQQMMNNPQAFNSWMNTMMQNPQYMNQMMGTMMQNPQFGNWMMGPMMNNPQFMNQWMSTMMNDPNFQQQYMGPWMMMRDPQSMQNMRNQYSQQTDIESLAVATDKVSILAETWQYQSTKAYSPSVIKISAGTTVTWTNDDQVIHTVTDLGNEFDSGFIQPDDTWEHTFDAKGNYYYFCSIHPWMTGAVIVS